MRTRLAQARDDRDQGFTLIELLVVVIIIGILAAIAIPVFLNQRKKGVDAGIKSDLKNLATVVETYATDNPSSTTALTAANVSSFKKSPNNVILLKGAPALGYCIEGYNTGGTANAAGTSFWYDSNAGGLKNGAPGAAPTGGACADATISAMTAASL